MREQNYGNHRKFVVGYHYVLYSILVVNLVWSVWRLFQGAGMPLFDRILAVGVAVALLLLAWYTRTFPLMAQNRVIRLEERLRLAQILPPDLAPRVGELTAGQLVALRFSSDEEVPELTRKVLDEKIRDQDQIKRMIRHWRPDHLRV